MATDQEEQEAIDFVIHRIREEGKVYQIANDFVHRFQTDSLPLTKQTQTIKVKNEFSGQTMTIPGYVGYLVSEYVRLSDGVIETKARYDKNPDGTHMLNLVNATISKEKVAEAINALWQYLRADNMIDADPQRKLEDCEQKRAELERELSDLRVKYEGLRRLLPDTTSEVETDEAEERGDN